MLDALDEAGQRVLVTSFTHRAINNALNKLVDVNPTVPAAKIGQQARADDLLAPNYEKFSISPMAEMDSGYVILITGRSSAIGEPVTCCLAVAIGESGGDCGPEPPGHALRHVAVVIPLTSPQDEATRVINEVREIVKSGVPLGHILMIHADWRETGKLIGRLRQEFGPRRPWIRAGQRLVLTYVGDVPQILRGLVPENQKG